MPTSPLQQAAAVAVQLGMPAVFAGVTAYMVVFQSEADLTKLLVGALIGMATTVVNWLFGKQA